MTTTTEDLTPILTSADDQRGRIRQKVLEGLSQSFPIKSRSKELELDDLHYEEQDFSPEQQKDAILRGDTLFETVKGTVRMRDDTGASIDEVKNFTVARIPWFTPRHTMIVGGIEYSIANQLRAKPGVYARKRRNGVLEASFNTRGGSNFSVTMDPSKGEPQLEYGTSRIPLYPILRGAGVSHKQIEGVWGKRLAAQNEKNLYPKRQQAVDKLYDRVIPSYKKKEGTQTTDKLSAVFESYSRSLMDPEVNKRTLGKAYSSVTPESMLDASGKVLKIFRNPEEVDDRDNLDFKTLHSVDDFFKEVVTLGSREVARKAAIKMERTPSLRKAIPSGPFTKDILRFINTSQLVSVPTQTNPMELIDSSMRVTSMGEGGIKSDRAIPMEARQVHVTQLNALDPFRTPETFRAGVDIRAAMGVKKDRKGNIFVPLRETASGKIKYLRAGVLKDKIVAFPGQELKGKVDALVAGEIRRVPASVVKYQAPSASMQYSPTTNLVPFLESMQGNRAVMGSKMQVQALSLVDRQEPLVQTQSPTGESFEHHMATMINPRSPVNGTVTRVGKNYVYIRPEQEKVGATKKQQDEKLIKVPYETNFPLAAKTHLHHEIKIKPGDRVTEGQQLGESNFTRNGKLSLGRNMRVAYMPYFGANSNDAVVISEGAAKKLTSARMYTVKLPVDHDISLDREKHRAYYGHGYQKEQYRSLDNKGVVRPGTIVQPHDPVVLGLRKSTLTADDLLLGRLHRSLARPYREENIVWDHDTPGEIVDVVHTPKRVAVTIKTVEPTVVGDKLCYTGDHDVLTERGWVPVAQVTYDDLCYTVNSTGVIELHSPVALHHYSNAEELYVLDTQQVSLRVTPNHTLYVQHRRSNAFTLCAARDTLGKRVRHKKDGIWFGDTPECFVLPPVKSKRTGRHTKITRPIDTRAWCRFLGVYLANGSYTIHAKKDRGGSFEYRTIVHSIAGQEHSVSGNQYSWIKYSINACGFDTNGKDDRFIISSRALTEYVSAFGHARNKHIPSDVFNWGVDAARAVMEGLLGCGGHAWNTGNLTYTTISPRLADDVQRLALHCGWAANKKEKVPENDAEAICYSVQIIKSKLHPQVNYRSTRTQNGRTEYIEPSDAPVWGITVPNHTLYIRHKGIPVFSGNSGRYGNKGTVSEIVPNDRMIKDEEGKPVDVIMTSAGVVSRTNPSQIIETAVGKVAEKTGKPILVENLSGRDNVRWAKELLKKHGIKDKETVYDPIHQKKIPGVFVGRQYILKLMKSTDTNYSARGLGNYDINQQPTKGGVSSAKALGKMEFDALVGHNARNVLREAATIKSQKNDEFWRATQLGYPTPPPKAAFAYNKFLNMLTGAGVRVHREGNRLSLLPLTDQDTLTMSAGEIREPKLIKAKGLKPEPEGLFDPAITGGLTGNKWAHVSLAEPVVNPSFREPVRRLLGVTGPELDAMVRDQGGTQIKKKLASINLAEKEKKLKRDIGRKSANNLDNEVKQLKYVRALNAQGLTPDNAYMISKVPVIPPAYRPVLPGKGGQELIYGDVNPLYRDLILVNNQLKAVKKRSILPGEDKKLRPTLSAAVGAVYGIDAPITAKSKARGHKGFLTHIAGVTSPKHGYFHSKLMSRTQDVAGRGTAVPDNTLGLDEVGVPETMLWTMYEKFLIKRLVQLGYPAIQAAQMVKEKKPAAKDALLREIKERPLMVNRAPTLHRYNIVGAYPKPVPGKTIRVNPFIEDLQNLDYDGDSFSGFLLISTSTNIPRELFGCQQGAEQTEIKTTVKTADNCLVHNLDSAIDFSVKLGYYYLHIRDFPRIATEVQMKKNKEVYEVPEGVCVFGFSEEKQQVQLCPVTKFSVHHDLDMVLVTTEGGKSVQVSAQNSLFGMDPNSGRLKRFSPIEHNDWAIPRPAELFTGQELVVNETPLAVYPPSLKDDMNTVNEATRPVEFTEGFGWLLGAYVGDGWIAYQASGNGLHIGLASVHPEIRGAYYEQCQQLLSDKELTWAVYDNPHTYQGKDCFSQKMHLYSAALADTLSRLFDRRRGAKNKRLPSFFTQAPKEFLYGLLAGLLDTDGTISIVKAKAKKDPQIIVHYGTISPVLADEVAALGLLLGVTTSIFFHKERQYYQVSFSTPEMKKIAHKIHCKRPDKIENLKKLANWDFTYYEKHLPKITVPVTPDAATALLELVGPDQSRKKEVMTDPVKLKAAKKIASIRVILVKARKTGRMGRATLNTLVERIGADKIRRYAGTDWFNNVANENIQWDFIQSVEPIEGRHTAWDLTVPDGNTFMTANQLIVFDTLMLHAPIGKQAVEEVKGMTLSNLLYSDKSRKDLLVFPQHEAVMGVAHASLKDDKNTPLSFKNQKDARKAYLDGKIGLGTRVEIGDKKK